MPTTTARKTNEKGAKKAPRTGGRSMKTNPFYIRDRLEYLIHSTPRLNLQQVAAFLQMDPSALTQARKRPNGLNWHVQNLAKFFHVPLKALTGLSDEESMRLLPSDPASKPGRRVGVASELPKSAPLFQMSGTPNEKGEFTLSAGCIMKRVREGENGPVRFSLLGPVEARPQINNLVFVEMKDGKHYVRRYTVDPNKPELVLLMPTTEGDTPIVVAQEDIESIRVMIAPLAFVAE
jgi:hypothetical protein